VKVIGCFHHFSPTLPHCFVLRNKWALFIVRTMKCRKSMFWVVTPSTSKIAPTLPRSIPPPSRAKLSLEPASLGFLAYFSTLKMEAICSSEKSSCFPTTRRYNPENSRHLSHQRGSFKPKTECMLSIYIYYLKFLLLKYY
jgi:hypothetical protein